ncbi:MAG: TolC family protein, partial [Verrucomicrobiota bacterium]
MNFFARLRTSPIVFCLILGLFSGGAYELSAQEETNLERKGFFKRIFSTGDDQSDFAPPGDIYTVHDVYMDRETDTVSALVKEAQDNLQREKDPVERFPHIPGYLTIKNTPEEDIDKVIEDIYMAYEARINRMDPPDLRSARIMAMGHVPSGFPAAWRGRANSSVWPDQRTVHHGIDDVYSRTLEYSNQVRVLRDLPLIRETGMQEADGEFDMEVFLEGRLMRTNEAIGSTLTTGNNATRFLENQDYLEGGLRKKFFTGAEATLSNRFSTLNNNSTFLTPQNQGSSELVLSVVQPLLEGAGYHYNKSKIKLARFDANMASAEFVRQLQEHLIEVNRAYWALYYSRSYYILIQELVADTQSILGQLEQRSDLDALQSEVLRARSSAAMRKAMLSRAEMAIRNSEERLRALVNDPNQDIGSNAELVPVTAPIMTRYVDGVQRVAADALRNRPEIDQGFNELRAAIVLRDMQKNEKRPTLNLVAELMLSDIEPNFGTGRAFNDQFGDGTGYNVGFQFSQPIDNDTDRAQLLRSEIELRQQANRLRATIDLVLLEAIVSYRELMTAYRDMQGRYSALQASREELRQLRDRLEVDTEEEGGRTTASQLQLILDSMDRNQSAEEMFLDSVVAYNASFASLERARGTFLRTENVEIKRVREEDETHPGEELETLKVTKSDGIHKGGGSSGYFDYEYYPDQGEIPDVPDMSNIELPSRDGESFASQDGDSGMFAENGENPSASISPAASKRNGSKPTPMASARPATPRPQPTATAAPSVSYPDPAPVATASSSSVTPASYSAPAAPAASSSSASVGSSSEPLARETPAIRISSISAPGSRTQTVRIGPST